MVTSELKPNRRPSEEPQDFLGKRPYDGLWALESRLLIQSLCNFNNPKALKTRILRLFGPKDHTKKGCWAVLHEP